MSNRLWAIVAVCLLLAVAIAVLLIATCGDGDNDKKDDDGSSASPSASGVSGSPTPSASTSPDGSGSASASVTAGPGQNGTTTPPADTGSSGPFPTPEVPPGQTPAPHGNLQRVAIDLDASGNSATSIASIQRCATVANGGSLTVDIVIVGIPPVSGTGGGIIGTSFGVLYDASRLKVTAFNDEMILTAAPGGSIFTAGNSTPDSDGTFQIDSLDVGTSGESGNGVLVRLTFQAIGSGTAAVSIRPVDGYYIDTSNEQQFFGDVSAARVVVGGSC